MRTALNVEIVAKFIKRMINTFELYIAAINVPSNVIHYNTLKCILNLLTLMELSNVRSVRKSLQNIINLYLTWCPTDQSSLSYLIFSETFELVVNNVVLNKIKFKKHIK